MALNATVASADSNSYVTLAEANAYFADRTFSTAWEDFDDQAAALVTASKQLDWFIKWKGSRVDGIQSMDWPRTGVYDPSDVLFASDVIPQAVKTAVFELALSSLDSDRTTDSDLAGLKEVRAASLMIKTDEGDFNSTAPKIIPDKIKKILDGLYTTSGIGVVRLLRA